MTTIRFDRVLIFGDKLSFLIPHDWVEHTEEADHYLYQAPNSDSGWLRVSLITFRGPPAKLRELLAEHAQKEAGKLYESSGNSVAAWEQPSEEDGALIHNYWWAVAHSHGPNLSREALFTYTILRDRLDDGETQKIVSLLSDLIRSAEFHDVADGPSGK